MFLKFFGPIKFAANFVIQDVILLFHVYSFRNFAQLLILHAKDNIHLNGLRS